jgi:hypothetical protein
MAKTKSPKKQAGKAPVKPAAATAPKNGLASDFNHREAVQYVLNNWAEKGQEWIKAHGLEKYREEDAKMVLTQRVLYGKIKPQDI